MLPFESDTRPVDLAQLSLIYPYNILPRFIAETILERVEKKLLRERGVIRYQTDSYYSLIDDSGANPAVHLGKEAEWSFGLPWLSLCHLSLGDTEKAKYYLERTESIILPDGSLPELYFAGKDEWNGNTPLGWANSMHILAQETYSKTVTEEQLNLF
jgi:phosphorylase kinase alpha/beta subunit